MLPVMCDNLGVCNTMAKGWLGVEKCTIVQTVVQTRYFKCCVQFIFGPAVVSFLSTFNTSSPQVLRSVLIAP